MIFETRSLFGNKEYTTCSALLCLHCAVRQTTYNISLHKDKDNHIINGTEYQIPVKTLLDCSIIIRESSNFIPNNISANS